MTKRAAGHTAATTAARKTRLCEGCLGRDDSFERRVPRRLPEANSGESAQLAPQGDHRTHRVPDFDRVGSKNSADAVSLG